VDVELSFPDAFPGIPRRIPASAEIGEEIEDRGGHLVVEDPFGEKPEDPEEKASGRQRGHEAPLLVLLIIAEGGVGARRILREAGFASLFET
jgi:hypothetical protein